MNLILQKDKYFFSWFYTIIYKTSKITFEKNKYFFDSILNKIFLKKKMNTFSSWFWKIKNVLTWFNTITYVTNEFNICKKWIVFLFEIGVKFT